MCPLRPKLVGFPGDGAADDCELPRCGPWELNSGSLDTLILQQSDECIWGYANWLCYREHQCLSPSHPRNLGSLLSQLALK